MKKFSGLILSFVCILTIILTGCTYADNATLLSIKEKYNYITTNNEEIFYGSELHLTYNSEDLLFLINSDNENYNILKTNSSISDYTTRGGYGLLMHCVNSTNLSNNALSIISNNAITDKKYKVGMYNALASLQENVKKLYNDKISLESVFITDERPAGVVAEQDLTLYKFNRFKNSLNLCLTNLLDFNKNYYNALVNNISISISLESLLYENTSSFVITTDLNNKLINNASILICDYVLKCSVGVKNNINDSEELLSLLARLMNEQYVLSGEPILDAGKIQDYKLIRAREDGLNKLEKSFSETVKKLKVADFESENKKAIDKVNTIESYKNKLKVYVENLLEYLED